MGILPAPPAKVPVPAIYSEKWGGGGLPLAINVSGTGPRCSLRIDEVRDPGGLASAIGPTAVQAGGVKYQLTLAFRQMFQKSGTDAIRARINLNGWLEGDWSAWYQFPYAAVFKDGLKQPPDNVKQIPPTTAAQALNAAPVRLTPAGLGRARGRKWAEARLRRYSVPQSARARRAA